MAAATSLNGENFLRLKSGDVFKRADFPKLKFIVLKFQSNTGTTVGTNVNMANFTSFIATDRVAI